MLLTEIEYKEFKKLYEELICKHYDSYSCRKVIENINCKWSKTTVDIEDSCDYFGSKEVK